MQCLAIVFTALDLGLRIGCLNQQKRVFRFCYFFSVIFYTVFQLLDADLRGRQLLRHGSAKFLNGLPHLATHVKVCGISLLCCLNQLFVMFFQLISQKQTLFVFTKLLKCFIVSKLLPSGLDSKNKSALPQ